MPSIQITASQRKERRAQAHHIDPVVAIGSDGFTEAVRRELDLALTAHGLIKVRVFSDDRDLRNALFASLADDLNAAPIQHIGKLLVFWRPVPAKESVRAEGGKPGIKSVKIVRFSKSGNHRPQIKTVRLMGNQRIAAGGEVKRVRQRIGSVKKTSQQA
ncbi:MAG: YhbY family RNA-binding protein [Burkholderiaceae bacterium]